MIGGMIVFSMRVDHRTSLQLLQQHYKHEVFELVDQNRQHLRQWLLWVDKRQSPEDFDPILPLWIYRYAENNGFEHTPLKVIMQTEAGKQSTV